MHKKTNTSFFTRVCRVACTPCTYISKILKLKYRSYRYSRDNNNKKMCSNNISVSTTYGSNNEMEIELITYKNNNKEVETEYNKRLLSSNNNNNNNNKSAYKKEIFDKIFKKNKIDLNKKYSINNEKYTYTSSIKDKYFSSYSPPNEYLLKNKQSKNLNNYYINDNKKHLLLKNEFVNDNYLKSIKPYKSFKNKAVVNINELMSKFNSNYTVVKYLGKGSYAKVVLAICNNNHYNNNNNLYINNNIYKNSFNNNNINNVINYKSTNSLISCNKIKDSLKVAIKILEKPSDKNALNKNFYNEINTLKIINNNNLIEKDKSNKICNKDKFINYYCPFIIKNYDFFEENNKLYIINEYISEGDLAYNLNNEVFFEESRAKAYIYQITTAIGYLHDVKNIIYRDLKPENILLNNNNEIRLIDFNLCKILKDKDKTYTICGTPEYIAPEILIGKGYGKSVDWWSLGILAYKMVTGSTPFKSYQINTKDINSNNNANKNILISINEIQNMVNIYYIIYYIYILKSILTSLKE